MILQQAVPMILQQAVPMILQQAVPMILQQAVLMTLTITSSGFSICRLTANCIFYYYSLVHPDDGCEYGRNMLMIINI